LLALLEECLDLRALGGADVAAQRAITSSLPEPA
jgi:hypothetical protein